MIMAPAEQDHGTIGEAYQPRDKKSTIDKIDQRVVDDLTLLPQAAQNSAETGYALDMINQVMAKEADKRRFLPLGCSNDFRQVSKWPHRCPPHRHGNRPMG